MLQNLGKKNNNYSYNHVLKFYFRKKKNKKKKLTTKNGLQFIDYRNIESINFLTFSIVKVTY